MSARQIGVLNKIHLDYLIFDNAQKMFFSRYKLKKLNFEKRIYMYLNYRKFSQLCSREWIYRMKLLMHI